MSSKIMLDIKILVENGKDTKYNIVIKVANITNDYIKNIHVNLIGSDPFPNKKSINVIYPRDVESVVYPMEYLPTILTCKISCNGVKYVKNKIL